jgi:hypothetical protein
MEMHCGYLNYSRRDGNRAILKILIPKHYKRVAASIFGIIKKSTFQIEGWRVYSDL